MQKLAKSTKMDFASAAVNIFLFSFVVGIIVKCNQFFNKESDS